MYHVSGSRLICVHCLEYNRPEIPDIWISALSSSLLSRSSMLNVPRKLYLVSSVQDIPDSDRSGCLVCTYARPRAFIAPGVSTDIPKMSQRVRAYRRLQYVRSSFLRRASYRRLVAQKAGRVIEARVQGSCARLSCSFSPSNDGDGLVMPIDG